MRYPKKRLIHFHGVFSEKYSGEPVTVYADSMYNLFNILFKTAYPNFLKEEKAFGIAFEDSKGNLSELFDAEQELSDDQKIIHIYPNPDGAYAQIIYAIIVIILSVGISLLLAPKLDSSQDTASGANWGSAENVVGQGGIMPVVLGKRLVGSRVASYGIDSTIFKKRL